MIAIAVIGSLGNVDQPELFSNSFAQSVSHSVRDLSVSDLLASSIRKQ